MQEPEEDGGGEAKVKLHCHRHKEKKIWNVPLKLSKSCGNPMSPGIESPENDFG